MVTPYYILLLVQLKLNSKMISCQYFAVHGMQMHRCCKGGAGNTLMQIAHKWQELLKSQTPIWRLLPVYLGQLLARIGCEMYPTLMTVKILALDEYRWDQIKPSNLDVIPDVCIQRNYILSLFCCSFIWDLHPDWMMMDVLGSFNLHRVRLWVLWNG